MNPQTLERLIIDRSLSGLSADTDALLTAYLEMQPAAAAVDQQMTQTAELVQRAMADEPVASTCSLPPLSVGRFVAAKRWQRRIGPYVYTAALAACLVLGFGLGALLFSDRSRLAETATTVRLVQNALDQQQEVTEDSGFWSIKNLRSDLSESPTRPSSYLIWDSPVSMPRRGGSL